MDRTFIFNKIIFLSCGNLIENKNLVENFKKNALTFSNTVFFQEDKLLELLNNRLEKNA